MVYMWCDTWPKAVGAGVAQREALHFFVQLDNFSITMKNIFQNTLRLSTKFGCTEHGLHLSYHAFDVSCP